MEWAGVPTKKREYLEMSSIDLKTVAEVAEQLRLSDRAIYDLCRVGRLRHLRLGNGRGAIRVAQADINAYKDACVSGGEQTPTLSFASTEDGHERQAKTTAGRHEQNAE